MGLFRKKTQAPPDLRAMWLSAEIPEQFRREPVSMVLVDWGLEKGCATVMAAADGSASLYFSTGGAIIGAGGHPGPSQASRALVRLCAANAANLKAVPSCPLPPSGSWAFNVRTPSGWRRFVAPEAQLENERHPAHPLFAATQELITAVRLVSS